MISLSDYIKQLPQREYKEQVGDFVLVGGADAAAFLKYLLLSDNERKVKAKAWSAVAKGEVLPDSVPDVLLIAEALRRGGDVTADPAAVAVLAVKDGLMFLKLAAAAVRVFGLGGDDALGNSPEDDAPKSSLPVSDPPANTPPSYSVKGGRKKKYLTP